MSVTPARRASTAANTDAGRAPVITAWQTYSPLGHGASAHLAALAGPEGAEGPRSVVADFETRQILGRPGTRAMDRTAGLAVATTGKLLAELGASGAAFDDYQPDELALVLGVGDVVASATHFLRDTWTRDRPYDVDPSHIPRTLMNYAAGQCAIWHGVRGPNTTICGDRTSALLALRYACRLRRDGHARAVLWGAVEERSAERCALEAARGSGPGEAPLSEGCVMFLLESAEHAASERPGGRTGIAEVLAVGFAVWSEPGEIAPALAGCLRRALATADLPAAEPDTVVVSALAGPAAEAERAAVREVFGDIPVRARSVALLGDGRAAQAAFQTVELLARPAAAGSVGVVTTVDGEGRVGCALLRTR
jgi:3-oxoacyl-[acyl-carrier-protein] synthase II